MIEGVVLCGALHRQTKRERREWDGSGEAPPLRDKSDRWSTGIATKQDAGRSRVFTCDVVARVQRQVGFRWDIYLAVDSTVPDKVRSRRPAVPSLH